jgi:hypothetical protein
LARSWVVHVDTLKGSRYGNMKELRFDVAEGVWRVAFAAHRRRQIRYRAKPILSTTD